jgi:hypothetical protein
MYKLLDDFINNYNNFPEESDPPVAGSEAEDAVSPAVKALQHLSESGITLAQLLDNILLGYDAIRSHNLVIAARTDIFSSSVLPQVMSRVRKPPKIRIRGKAHIKARNELQKWALDISVDILQKKLAQFAKTAKSSPDALL